MGGIITFSLAAPAAILLAQGYIYDFQNHKIVKTGTLIVKTDPKGTEIFLNGKKAGIAPMTIRFLLPREYTVDIRKGLYLPWKKRVLLRAGQVVSLSDGMSGKIPLFFERPDLQAVSTTTNDFYSSSSGKILFLEKNPIWRLKEFDPQTSEMQPRIDIIASFTSPRILEENNNEFLIADQNNTWYVNPETQKPILVNLASAKLTQNKAVILGINDKYQLVDLDVRTAEQSVIQNGVKNFVLTENGDIFLLTAENSPRLLQIVANQQPKVILDNLPAFTNSQILVSPTRQIFLVFDQTLFAVTEALQKINDNASYAYWDASAQGLVYGSSHESWLYQPLGANSNMLLTRTADNLGTVRNNAFTGFVFTSQGQEIKATEFDSSGQPNFYTLAQTKNANVRFALDQNATHLIYLDGNNLVALKIR